MFVACEFVEELLFGELLAVGLFCAKLFGYGELGHYRVGVDVIHFHFVGYQLCIADGLWQVGEDVSHLFGCLEPLLFGVVHSVLVVQVLIGAQADESVMCFSMLFFHEVCIVGGYDRYVKVSGESHKNGVHLLLCGEGMLVAAGFVCPVALQFDVIVVLEEVFEPGDGLLCFFESTVGYVLYLVATAKPEQHFLWQFASQTG